MALDFTKIEGFEWDKGNLEHIKKHNVDYRECEQVFFNKPVIFIFDPKHSIKEKRYRVLGESDQERKLALAITLRARKITVITARGQSRKERKFFETERRLVGEKHGKKT